MKSKEEIYRGAEERFWKCNGRDFEEHEVTQLEKQQYVSGYLEGYTKCQEDNAVKKYTEDDIKETAYFFVSKKLAANQGILDDEIQDFINSLNKQD